VHGGGRSQPAGVAARLQTLFYKTAAIDYFIVDVPVPVPVPKPTLLSPAESRQRSEKKDDDDWRKDDDDASDAQATRRFL
jgi:hypothetical protein